MNPAAPFRVSPSRIARYFFHECDRYLRYVSATKEQRRAEGIPSVEADRSLITRALLEGGFAWETEILDRLGDDAVVAARPGDHPLHERRHTAEDTLELLAVAQPGQFIYQPTIVAAPAFYDRFGLDPDLVRIVDCHPDLLQVLTDDEGGVAVRVVDAKASDMMKLSHRIQVALYSMLLEAALQEAGLADRIRVPREGAVWLYGHDEPEVFDLSLVRPPLEVFLAHDLQPLLRSPAKDAFWHLWFRCEWCDYYDHCRGEADATDDVSLVPYLSTFAKRHLAEQAGVHTVSDLGALLERPDADDVLTGCASLEGRVRQLRLAVDALTSGEPRPTGAASVGMPKGEHVRLVLTLQSEPLTGGIYTWGLNRVGGNDVVGDTDRTLVQVAPSASGDDLARLRAGLVDSLSGILRAIDDHNRSHAEDWKAQKTVQVYVFDSYERELLVEALLEEALLGERQEEALALLFWFQHPDLADAEDHPASEVFFPVIVLTDVLRRLTALPVPIVYRLAEVNATLRPRQYAFEYRDNEFHGFRLSNRMKSNAIFDVWHRGRGDLVEGIERELRFRMWGANSVINGLREELDGTGALFAWPPKFSLPPGLGFQHPTLSRLAFIARYETVLQYLDIRSHRMAPREDQLQSDRSVELIATGDGLFDVAPGQSPPDLQPSPFWDWILTLDTPDGQRARLTFDDFAWRKRSFSPKHLALALARVTAVGEDATVALELKESQAFTAPTPGQRCVLDIRFTDWTTDGLVAELDHLDDEGDPWFVRLLDDPVGTRSPTKVTDDGRSAVLELAAEHGMTASQLDAFAGVVDHDVQLVWGPPGTGKTHFLALAVLCLAEAHRRRGRHFRVLLTAFTHTAIDNCLHKLIDLQADQQAFGGDLAVKKLHTMPSADLPVLHPDSAVGFAVNNDIVVYGATVWQARKVDPDDLAFDLVVIDEGSQLTVGQAAIAVRRLRAGGRLLIAGDDRQLPPIVVGSYPAEEGRPPLHRSILEALRALDPDDTAVAPLLENFRMCDVLCEYPRNSIYPDDYAPANDEIAGRRLPISTPANGDLTDLLLDPAFPVTICVLEDVRATRENPFEAGLVADVAEAYRRATPGSDDEFWADRMFIVSPHHAQIRLINKELAARREWDASPFVDTVDKMQGQECDLVVVSYGVSDVEYALSERQFIYSLNRLNVAITRARMKTILFVSRVLLEPPLQALDHDEVAEGIAYMQGLARWGEAAGHARDISYGGRSLTILRA